MSGKPNPFASLVRSRKVWIGVFDLVVSLALYFVGKYAPSAADDLKFVVFAIQPVFLLIIGSIAWQNVRGIQAQADIKTTELYNELRMRAKEPE